MSDAVWWFLLNLISIAMSAFYSMQEMACVSFNKIRLNYYVSQGKRSAIWVNHLLEHPSFLFGTTLMGVNVAMFFGSECARKFHEAIGINPDLAPLSQVVLVVIFGELAPMFAARQYPEHVSLLGAPLLYASAKLATPFLKAIDVLTTSVNKILGGKEKGEHIFLDYEELQRMFEEDAEAKEHLGEAENFNAMAGNIFGLRQKDARAMMKPLYGYSTLPSDATVLQMRNLMKKNQTHFILVYHRNLANIIGVVFPRDVIRFPDSRRIRDYARSPWFITQKVSSLQILEQFKRNASEVAVVIDDQGKAIGVLQLNDLLDEIFDTLVQPSGDQPKMTMDRTFPGHLLVREFNQQFGVILDERESLTLSDLIAETLERQPEEGDSVLIGQFVLTVTEATLREAKRVNIETKDY